MERSPVQVGDGGQHLTEEDQLFLLFQAGLYLTSTRGLGAPEARICYVSAESLCRSLNDPRLLYVALMGQWRYSLVTDKLSATMQIAKRVHLLAQEQNEPAPMIGACAALAITHYFSGNFEVSGQCAIRGVQIWRSGGAQSPVEEVDVPGVACLCYEVLFKWHIGEIASSKVTIEETISVERELNDMHGLAVAIHFASILAYFERSPAEVERLASDVIELSTRQNFAYWLAVGAILRGWARSASGDTTQGIAWIENGIGDCRAIGSMICIPYLFSTKG
jgi:predicted ATPase